MRFIDCTYILEFPGDTVPYPHRVYSKYTGLEYTTRINWCHANFDIGEWAIDPYIDVGYEYYFKHSSDAILFKLMFPE
jgi:hypothetical protein